MSLSDTDVKAKYNGNGVTLTFARVHATIDDVDAETEVYTIDESVTPPVATLKVNPTHYSNVGANVVFLVAPAAGIKVLVSRAVDLIQTDFAGDTNGPYPAADAELTYDKIVGMLQWLNEKILRAPKFRKSYTVITDPELPDPSANKYLKWNSTATALENGVNADDIADALVAATEAAASASAAATSASAAATSATNSANSAVSAAASATAAAASALTIAAAIVTGSAVVTNGQGATAVTSMIADSSTTHYAEFFCGVLRGTTVCWVYVILMYDGTNWNIEEGPGGGGAHGLTFTQNTSGGIAQVRIAADSSGNGSMYFSRRVA